MEIISRKEAKEQGLKRYFTGKPCKYGHVADRRVSGGDCYECKAEKDRKYREQNKDKIAERERKYREQNSEKIAEKNRKYREQNKDKVADWMRKNYEQNKDKIAERMRKYREQNKDKITENDREYREKNKDKIVEYHRKHYEQNKERIVKYREQNKDKISEQGRKWRKSNPDQVFIRDALKRILNNWKGGRAKAEKLLGYTCGQLRERIESQFKEGMSWANRSEWHIDHIKPIKAFLDEGITDPKIINALDNLQPLWAHENLSKGAKYDG